MTGGVKAAAPAKILKMLGMRVAELRRAKGWTQEDLAGELRVAPRYVQSIEAGKENLSVESLVQLANVLKTGVPSLFQAPKPVERRVGRPPKLKNG